LDDLLLLHADKDYLYRVGQDVMKFFRHFGWTVNVEKSHLDPSQEFAYLGWIWNSVGMSVKLPKERVTKALTVLRSFRKASYTQKPVTARALAKLIGIISSTRLQFRSASLLYSKLNHLKTQLVNEKGWDSKTIIYHSLIGELKHWSNLFKTNTPRKIYFQDIPQAVITTDASPSD
jgi:hypothetical protein